MPVDAIARLGERSGIMDKWILGSMDFWIDGTTSIKMKRIPILIGAENLLGIYQLYYVKGHRIRQLSITLKAP